MMDENVKVEEWVHMNRQVFEACEINAFLYAIKGLEDNPINIFPNHRDRLDNLFLFFGLISRVYVVTELDKIVNPADSSFSLHSFLKDHYPDKQCAIWRKFSEWKKATQTIRKNISAARNRYSSHTDKESFRKKEYFGLFIEEMDDLLEKTLQFLDFIYENDTNMKSEFDKNICMAGPGSQKPSQIAESWKRLFATNIKSLQVCCGKN